MTIPSVNSSTIALKRRRPCQCVRLFARLWPVYLLGYVAIVSCHDLTSASDPDVMQPGVNNDSLGAVYRRAGAIMDFSVAYGWQVMGSGLISDEMGTVSGAIPGDQRVPGNGDYRFDLLSAARINILRAINSLKEWAPSPTWHVGELYAYLANVELFFSENLCSGVPLGTVVNDVPTYGPTLTRSELISQALIDFDSAAKYATGSDSVAQLALVGRARALLDSGDFSAAVQHTSSVSSTFVFSVGFAPLAAASSADQNPVYLTSPYGQGQTFVSDREGINGLDFVSANDPRVQIASVSSLAAPIADSSASSPITLATGIEARLIEAEALLHLGNVVQWANTLNTLRQSAITPSMPMLSVDSTANAAPAEQLAVMFRERAFWLFLTGHRQGDMLRLIRQYGVPAESVFPTGLYQGGPATYGSAVVYQPGGETLNPNFHGCFDTGAGLR
jgi:hypothetical protein